MHVGMEMAEAHEEARDELGGGEEGEAHRRLLGAFHFLDLPLGAVQLVHNALCVAQEDLPVAGEDDIPAAPLEKRDAQIIFQRFDGAGQRGLRDVQLLRHAGQMLFFRCLLKVGQGKECRLHRFLSIVIQENFYNADIIRYTGYNVKVMKGGFDTDLTIFGYHGKYKCCK